MDPEPASPTAPSVERPPRLWLSNPAINRMAAEAAFDGEIRRWLADEYREEDREGYISDLADVPFYGDGYEIASALEGRHHWQPDSELVDILEGGWIYDAHGRAVKEWVAANGVRPGLSIGTAVTSNRGNGVIVGISEADGTYTVNTGEERFGARGGIVLPYEDCIPAAPQPERVSPGSEGSK